MSALAIPLALALASACAPSVAPGTLLAVAKHESGLDPLVIHDNTTGKTQRFRTANEGVSVANSLLRARHSLDFGLMQVNSANLARLNLTPREAFDPCASMRAGAKIMVENWAEAPGKSQVRLRRVLSAYNTGDQVRGFANGYVRKVEASAAQIIPEIQIAGVRPSPAPSSKRATVFMRPARGREITNTPKD